MRTPGLWKVNKFDPYETKLLTVFGGDETESRGPSKVCDTLNEADAHLIAAAPDLLEVARLSLGLVEMSEKDIEATICDAARKQLLQLALDHFKLQIRNAILKAHGQAEWKES